MRTGLTGYGGARNRAAAFGATRGAEGSRGLRRRSLRRANRPAAGVDLERATIALRIAVATGTAVPLVAGSVGAPARQALAPGASSESAETAAREFALVGGLARVLTRGR